jgi:DNA polymerase III delta prime subunit
MRIDEDQHLILLWDKSQNRFQDGTSEIQEIDPTDKGFAVTYRNNPKIYRFNSSRLRLLEAPIPRPIADGLVFVNERLVPNVRKALIFGELTKLFLEKGCIVVDSSAVAFDRNSLRDPDIDGPFRYFTEIAALLGNQEDGESFLKNALQSIQHLSEHSVLTAYLRGSSLQSVGDASPLVFPFGVNRSQKQAVERAFKHRMSIIQGPPGTGKTQTILNIIANVIYRGRTVAIVSGNNSATQNVYEKLEKAGYGFLAALLGNTQKQKDFFATPPINLESTAPWIRQKAAPDASALSAIRSLEKLDHQLDLQNEGAQMREKKSRLLIEQQHYLERFPRKDFSFGRWSLRRTLSGRQILDLLGDLEASGLEDRSLGLLDRIRLFFSHGVFWIPDDGGGLSGFARFLHQSYYERSLVECHERIREIEGRLHFEGFEDLMRAYQEASEQLMRDAISARFKDFPDRKFFPPDVRRDFEAFSHRFPVVLSTTHSIRRCIQDGCSFDYVIIDEASQVDLVTAAIAMSCCRNLVIVGDPMQLPHIVDTAVEQENPRLMANFGIPPAYDYASHHVIASLVEVYGDRIPITLLKEHYRCHPQIIRFCNQKYYKDELIILTPENDGDHALQLVKTAPGNHERKARNSGWINRRQIEVIRDEVIPALGLPDEEIGIVTPYREQANLARELVEKPAILSETVHKFQGREKQAIIISPVKRTPDAFMDDKNMVNVAVSRARSRLVLVTARDFSAPHGSNLGDLMRYISYVGGHESVIDSQKISIFDCLYSEYATVLEPLLKRVRRVSQYRSENLMFTLIRTLLEQERFDSLKVVLHFPLRYLIRNLSPFSARERTYIENPFTHVDFAIFNKLDKEPVLAVEVDGYSFHELNSKQRERDVIKNQALQQAGVPFIRFSTVGSDEESRLEAALIDALVGQPITQEENGANED